MLLGIGFLTLTPQPDPGFGGTGVRCLLCGSRGVADLLLNIGLFVPVGFALGARGLRPIQGLGIALGIAATIELLQAVIPGREATYRDVLTNAIGGGLGTLLFANGLRWVLNRREATFAALISLGAMLGAVSLTGPLLSPLPAPSRVYVGWNPAQDHLERWTGVVHRVEIGSVSAAPGGNADGALVDDALLHAAPIEIWATAGRPTTRVAGLFTVNDQLTNEILLVGIQRNDLVVRFRRVSSFLRLASPTVRFRDALASADSGGALHIRLESVGSEACATVNDRRECQTAESVGSAWTFFSWIDNPPPALAGFLDGLTLSVAFALLTLFLPAAGMARGAAFLVSAPLGAAVIGTLSDLLVFGVNELAGTASGMALGLGLANWIRRRASGFADAPSRDLAV